MYIIFWSHLDKTWMQRLKEHPISPLLYQYLLYDYNNVADGFDVSKVKVIVIIITAV